MKNIVYSLLLVACAASCGCVPEQLGDAQLTAAGAQPPVILLSPKATDAERWSAKELAAAIEQMVSPAGRVKITTNYKTVPKGAFCFLLGVLDQSPTLQELIDTGALSVPKDRPKFDGFVLKAIKKDDRNIMIIASRHPRGVMNGVFHLLERVWGCGFFEDAFETVRYPKYETLLVPWVDEIIEPAFEHREVIYLPNYASPRWSMPRRRRNMDYLCRLRYNRFQPKWYICPAAFAEELRDRKLLKTDRQLKDCSYPVKYSAIYTEEVKLLKHWHSRGGRVTLRKPSGGYNYLTVALLNKVRDGFLGFGPEQANQYFNPNLPLILDIDLQSSKKLKSQIGIKSTDNWIEIGLPSENSSWSDEKDRLVYLLNYAKAGLQTLKSLDPDGKLVLNSWSLLFSPWTKGNYREFFKTISAGGREIVICDIMALDGVPTYKAHNYYYGHPWLVGAIPQIATVDEPRLNMPYALKMAQDLVKDSRENPKNNLIGFCYQTEGSGGMPMTMDFLHLIAWDPMEWTIEKFVADYAARRYGRKNASAMIPALNKLMESVHGPKTKLNWGRYYPASPHKELRVTDALNDSTGAYRARASLVPIVREALVEALAAAPVLKNNPYYVRDLIDIARMYCYFSEEIWLAKAWKAVKKRDAAGAKRAGDAMDVILESLTRLLATHPRYWNKSRPYGYEGNDYYTNDTYEQLKHLYSIRIRGQLEFFRDLIVKGQNDWPLTKAIAWRKKLYKDTRQAYNDGPPEWRNIPKSDQFPMSPAQAAAKLLVDVSRVNSLTDK
ncbi:MAG: alpha-N-acetylglucosaminidase C-terminal domain-containing protein [Planctomycetota bacterium]|nr:alpha-N-acetylglucosaminidase C-terminal domain-containing protein [Planctomycetota bacterium]